MPTALPPLCHDTPAVFVVSMPGHFAAVVLMNAPSSWHLAASTRQIISALPPSPRKADDCRTERPGGEHRRADLCNPLQSAGASDWLWPRPVNRACRKRSGAVRAAKRASSSFSRPEILGLPGHSMPYPRSRRAGHWSVEIPSLYWKGARSSSASPPLGC